MSDNRTVERDTRIAPEGLAGLEPYPAALTAGVAVDWAHVAAGAPFDSQQLAASSRVPRAAGDTEARPQTKVCRGRGASRTKAPINQSEPKPIDGARLRDRPAGSAEKTGGSMCL